MPPTRNPEKLIAENQRLRAEAKALRTENRRLVRESEQLKKRLATLTERLGGLRGQQALLERANRETDDKLRWLSARVRAIEKL